GGGGGGVGGGRGGGGAPLVVASRHALTEPADDATARRLAAEAAAALGPALRGTFVTELAKNDFPRLPVRDKEFFFVSVAAFPDQAASPPAGRAPRAQRLDAAPPPPPPPP